MRYRCLLILCLFVPSASLLAWGATGHRVIGAIAYAHLTPAAKQAVNKYSLIFSKSKLPLNRFMAMSAWPDFLRMRGVDNFNQWHFVAYPYERDGVKGHRYPRKSLVWAVRYNEYLFKNSQSSRNRGKALAFIVHLFGDGHQPMHCITLYSKRFPRGDENGLRYKLDNARYQDLHQYWDAGGGLLTMSRIAYSKYLKKVSALAKKLQQQYPWSSLQKQAAEQNPKVWTRNSYEIAKDTAYSIPFDSKITKSYRQAARQASAKQLVLAGYRIAYWLNHNVRQQDRVNKKIKSKQNK